MNRYLDKIDAFLDERLQPAMRRTMCGALIVIGVAFVVVNLVGAEERRTPFGPPLGPDFGVSFCAGRILAMPATERDRLYDYEFHRELYHAELPQLKNSDAGLIDPNYNPYVYPPFIALGFRLLAPFSYETAFAIWLAFTLALYLAGLTLAWRAFLPAKPPPFPTIDLYLVALAYEPFLMECWIAGQLSCIGFFAMSAAFWFLRGDRPFLAGMMAGVCCFKPTLLVLFVPMLLILGRWRILAGLTAMVAFLAVISLVGAGEKNCRDFVDIVLGFAGTNTATGAEPMAGLPIEVERRDWKWVDLNYFYRILFWGSPVAKWFWVATSAALLALVVRSWWRGRRGGDDGLLWASTLVWTLVINLYIPVYDTILAVLACVWTWMRIADVTRLPRSFRWLMLLIFVMSWVNQPIARHAHFQVLTPLLIGLAWFMMSRVDFANTNRADAQCGGTDHGAT